MGIIVQKFGGTSVASQEGRRQVCERIMQATSNGNQVVAVVSAMGRQGAPYATDTLLDLLRLECPLASARELDMVFVCGEMISATVVAANLQQLGHKAIALTGAQAGIVTDDSFGDAQILEVSTVKLRSYLDEKYIVVVAGCQGVTPDGHITTLGRGGSDITACALGVYLDAERVDIYTDVEGIMTADPRVCPDAELITEITHEACYSMAAQGAKVIHPRAVEIASARLKLPVRVRSTFTGRLGTLIIS